MEIKDIPEFSHPIEQNFFETFKSEVANSVGLATFRFLTLILKKRKKEQGKTNPDLLDVIEVLNQYSQDIIFANREEMKYGIFEFLNSTGYRVLASRLADIFPEELDDLDDEIDEEIEG